MKKFFSICIALIIVFITSTVFATTNFIVKLESNKSIIKSGEELEVVIKLDNFTENENGINVFLGTLEYDKNIFEEVQEDDIQTLEFWTAPVYNTENGKFIVDANSFVNTSHDALKIKLKVKENMNIDTTTTEIKLKDISASDGQNDIYPEEASISLEVEKTNNIDEKQSISENKMIIIILVVLAVVIIVSICIVLVKKKSKI